MVQPTPRRIPKALILAAALTFVLLPFPKLIRHASSLSGIFALVLMFVPTFFIYYLVAWIPSFALGQRLPTLRPYVSILAILSFAIGVPILCNRQLESQIRFLQSRNQPPPVKLSHTASIRLHTPSLSCDYLCQTLLLNGAVQEVILTAKTQSRAIRLTPHSPCEIDSTRALLQPVKLADTEQLSPISVTSHLFLTKGGCFLSSQPSNPMSGLELKWISEEIDLGLGIGSIAGPISLRGLELIVPGEWTAQEIKAYSNLIYSPFMLMPMGKDKDFDRWVIAKQYDQPRQDSILDFLNRLTDFKLSPPPAPSIDEIRERIDALLADPNANSAAFLLVEDYERYLWLGRDATDPIRIASLIRDPRLDDFQILKSLWRSPAPSFVAEAILFRLTHLESSSDKLVDNLQNNSAALPHRAFVNTDLAAAFEDIRVSRLSSKLLPRLSEEGPTAIPKLLRIIQKGITQPDVQNPLWGKEILSASVGLCRLSHDARDLLPELIRLQHLYSNTSITHSTEWRGLLVALGHPIATFDTPPGEQQINYQIKLRHQSNHCSVLAT
jgi:hypothetical protein